MFIFSSSSANGALAGLRDFGSAIALVPAVVFFFFRAELVSLSILSANSRFWPAVVVLRVFVVVVLALLLVRAEEGPSETLLAAISSL